MGFKPFLGLHLDPLEAAQSSLRKAMSSAPWKSHQKDQGLGQSTGRSWTSKGFVRGPEVYEEALKLLGMSRGLQGPCKKSQGLLGSPRVSDETLGRAFQGLLRGLAKAAWSLKIPLGPPQRPMASPEVLGTFGGPRAS